MDVGVKVGKGRPERVWFWQKRERSTAGQREKSAEGRRKKAGVVIEGID